MTGISSFSALALLVLAACDVPNAPAHAGGGVRPSRSKPPPTVGGILIDGCSGRFRTLGSSQRCVAVVTDSVGTGILDLAVDWVSTDPEVVTVTDSGVVTARDYGRAGIVASIGNRSGRFGMVVIAPTSRYEAAVLALYESRELRPPADMVDRFFEDLTRIRNVYGLDVPAVDDIRSYAPWVPSNVVIGFTVEGARLAVDGGYHWWDSLNTALGALPFDTSKIDRIAPWTIVREFDQLLHPWHLVQLYGALPRLKLVDVNRWRPVNHSVFASRHGSRWSYLFRRGPFPCAGWCPSNEEYWYFSADGDSLVYHGHWRPFTAGPSPGWWTEACPSVDWGSSAPRC